MLLLYIMLPLFKVKSFSSLTICDSKIEENSALHRSLEILLHI